METGAPVKQPATEAPAAAGDLATLPIEQLAPLLDSVPLPLALYDADDRLVIRNRHLDSLVGAMATQAPPGAHFEDILRRGIATGRIAEAVGREDEHFARRLAFHRNPVGTFEEHIGERWVLISEYRLPNGGTLVVYTDATETKRREEALRDSERRAAAAEARLLGALEATSDGFILYDSADRVVLCNSRMREFYPSLADLLRPGTPFEDLVRAVAALGLLGDETADESFVAKRLALRGKHAGPYERRLKDGRWLLVEQRPTAVGGTVTVASDITELKRREEALVLSEQRLRDIAESSSDWFWEMDAELRFTEFVGNKPSPTPLRFEDMIGRTRWEAMDADPDRDPLWRQHRDDLAARRPFRDFCFTVERAGMVRHFCVSGTPYYDAAGNFAGYRGTTTDQTEKIEAERAASRVQAQLIDTINNVPVGVAVYDIDDRLILRNNVVRELSEGAGVSTGNTLEDITRRMAVSGLIDEAIGREDDFVAERIAHHHDPSVPFEFTSRGRSIQMRTYRAANGNSVVIMTDVTDHRRRDEELLQSQKMEAVGQMTGGLAHDFNNLIAVIIGNLELLEERFEPNTRERELIDRAIGSAERGASLTQRLLQFARRQPLRPRPLDINTLVQGLTDLARRTLGTTMEVRTALAPGLPPVAVDQAQMESALLNLAVNARDAMPKGGVLTIETGAAPLPGDGGSRPGVVVAISDTGEGMDPETVKRAFEPFFTTKKSGEGTGLGLSMVYGFVSQSGGRVSIQSTVGTGTTVRIHLPAAPQPAATN